ncbi:hypothetical protein QQF64_033925 [Cirrhinus molitorella]|uniref:Uncharacterized protein n=1 Tax=Cirrhinus molitorella TaxID=172907 RepID=A0ABR3MVA3_9TELE
MPPLSINVVCVVLRWSDDRYVARIDSPSALREPPAGFETSYAVPQLIQLRKLDVITPQLVSHGLTELAHYQANRCAAYPKQMCQCALTQHIKCWLAHAKISDPLLLIKARHNMLPPDLRSLSYPEIPLNGRGHHK